MKQIIRLTESDLHRLVKESVYKILAETDASSSGDVNRPVFPMMRRPSPVGEPTDEKIKLVDISGAIDRDGGDNHSITINHVTDSKKKVNESEEDGALMPMNNHPFADRDKWKATVKQDRDRLQQLMWNNEYKNHPNRHFLNSETKFGHFDLYLEEAAFQLLGIDRFAIGGLFAEENGMMPNPWEDIYHILKWAIDNKGLNPNYLRKVSNKDWQADDDEYGMKPDIMSSDDWDNYVMSVNNGEQRIFTSEELRDISSHLPLNLKKSLYNDLINVSRIGLVGEMVDHMLAMNDGENALQFCNAVDSRIYQLRGAGFNPNRLYNNKSLRVIVADALKENPELQNAQKYIGTKI